jgi:hypothetical protein
MRRRRAIMVAVLLAPLLAGGVMFYRQVRPYESTEFATVSWQTGGEPFQASVTVIDPSGAPVVGTDVWLSNNSGGNVATTDARGHAVLLLDEADMLSMHVNRQRVVHRPLAYHLGTPNVKNGLVVRIELKPSKPAG